MKIHIVAGDICGFNGDVVVNAANPAMLGGGGVDGAIHRGAGPALKEACKMVWKDADGVRCPVGQVRPTPAFNLPCKWVFHTSGPIFNLQRAGFGHPGESIEGDTDPEGLLKSCFRRCGVLAVAMGLESIAFPAISTGVYGCPQETCARVAAEWIRAFNGRPLDVTFYIHPAEHLGTWMKIFEGAGIEIEC
ncbi:MAG: macro domain-containing protein [Bacteroidota bacterium]|jgi:O-acetyl-ADP-ribose deacetylase (regulator of RNase III)